MCPKFPDPLCQWGVDVSNPLPMGCEYCRLLEPWVGGFFKLLLAYWGVNELEKFGHVVA